MSYNVPTPDTIADQQSTVMEQQLSTDKDGNPRVIDARSERSVLGAIARSNAGALYASHLHLRRIADELMPDTAEDWLSRHGGLWGVARRAATGAVGQVTFTGPAGGAIPSGVTLTLNGVRWITVASATLGSGGAATVSCSAVNTGAVGNVAAGMALALVSPLLTLSAQQAVVAAGGISGGADIESLDSWKARILAKIREPAHGGATFDYEYWAQQVIAYARLNVMRAWVGAGSVGVAFVMPVAGGGVRAPTTAEIKVLDDYLQVMKPVEAEVITLAGTLTPVNVTVAVSPNSQTAIDAATAAIKAWFLSAEFDLGAPLRLSRLSEAISAATGETYHRITAPAADVLTAQNEMLVLGTLTVTGIP